MTDTVSNEIQEKMGDGPLELRAKEVIDIDEEDIIDDEQVDEFKEQLEALGSFPDKVMINTLSMIAADYRDSKVSAAKLYSVWKHQLLNCHNVQEKMPIIYVLDSILKNVQGAFIQIVEEDVPYQWLSSTYHILPTVQQQKLYKVYMTWKEYSIFSSIEKWNRMGQCFIPSSAVSTSASSAATASSSQSAIPRGKDGTLILAKNVRQEMQNILDDMQTDVVNELDKVSLERLADINPELLMNIKRAAEDGIHLLSTGSSSAPSKSATSAGMLNRKSATSTAAAIGGTKSSAQQSTLPSFLMETRSASAVQRSSEWHNVLSQKNKNPLGPSANGAGASVQSNALMVEDIVQKLQQLIRDGCTDTDETKSGATLYTQQDALSTIQYCGTASAISQLLQRQPTSTAPPSSTTALERTYVATSADESAPAAMISNLLQVHIHAEDFTTEGIKKKSAMAVSLLYELGLPFQSTADGKRFRTQQQLSYHLDRIFQQKQRKNQAETASSSMERGWYINDFLWVMGSDVTPISEQTSIEESLLDPKNVGTTENSTDPNFLFTVPADESRDTCVVCGLKFVMFFDTNEGQYKYRNCREIPVDMEMESDVALENDDEPDIQFVHGTCWMGLGEPSSLSYDQTIYNTQ